MLDDLSDLLVAEKRLDLIKRLDSKLIGQNMPAEMELAILWATKQTGDVVVEPEWWGGKSNPDGYSESIVPNVPVVFDIVAVSNGSVSQQDAMRKVANRIKQFASNVRRKFGNHLSFYFFEEGAITKRYGKRRILVNKDYDLSDTQRANIRHWITSDDYKAGPIQILEDGVAFQLTYESGESLEPLVSTSMPPACYSLTKNPIYKALDRKRKQLSDAPEGTLKVIFLADVGAELIHQIGGYIQRSWDQDQTYGPEIIGHFLSKYRNEVDAVVTLSAWDMRFKASGLLGVRTEPNRWEVNVFSSPASQHDWNGISSMISHLPPPRLDANLARQHQQHGSFRPTNKIRYKSAGWSYRKNPYRMKIKLSAGAFRDLISGELEPEKFLDSCIPPEFRDRVKDQKSITSIEFERGENSDDDLIVLAFEDDPAVKPFQ